jgi:Mobilization protein NikA
MKQAESATERVTVLMTREEKSALEAKAKVAGVSVGEFVRRSVVSFDPDEAEDLVQLAALAAELHRSNAEAHAALDRALAAVEATHAQLTRRYAA